MDDFLKAITPFYRDELKSRVHKINSIQREDLKVYIKRDDELSFSSSGSKVRKLSSLIPYIIEKKPKLIGLIGSSLSHFVLALAQRCIEQKLPFTCYLKKPHFPQKNGNALLLSILSPKICWIDTLNWPQVIQKAESECDLVIPEGGFMMEAFAGCCSLGLDILRNEKELNLSFDHIFVDAGSGLTALSLILFFSLIDSRKRIHVLSCADSKELFEEKLSKMSSYLKEVYQTPFTYKDTYTFNQPCQGKSFGSTSTSLFAYIRSFAQKEGVFLDPIYSAKLFQTFETTLQKNLHGNALLIHSGGGTSLFSFEKALWNHVIF
jgi:1-aminocyclopropane-1-carboxylate deaminase/D-cysteine desulfhydrase-like pyridoxal-dependent ACC family enzyme